MPYIIRDPAGAISGVLRSNPGGAEYVEGNDPELRSFLEAIAPTGSEFQRLDAEFVRVLEDVIETLMARNLLTITDLPEDAQAKLFARKSFRERSGRNALNLFVDTDYGDVI